MHITVAICTWNRSGLLDQTLTEMTQLRPPVGGWELVIVNNNCSDDTDSVIAKHQQSLPIRRFFEPRPGQTNARNHAIRVAQGELIVWTDDDVLVESDWLTAYRTASEANPNVSFFGGPVRPWFEVTPPKWLGQVFGRVETAYATRDFGDDPFFFDSKRTPFGANYAIRTRIQQQYPYDPQIGLRPGSTMRGDEVSVLRQMLADGHQGRWVPDAAVRHFIPRQRMSIGYLTGFFSGQGQFLGRSHEFGDCPKLLGIPRWLIRQAIAAEANYRFSRLFRSSDRWIEALIAKSVLWGRVRAAYQREK